MFNIRKLTAPLAILFVMWLSPIYGQNLKHGTVLHIKIHGKNLEGNLDGDSPDRNVAVYLPPSYNSNPKRHYPVVYFLHGFTDNEAKWYGLTKHWINLPAILDTAYTAGNAKEMIFVTPNADTRFRGSMYSNSVTTGNWENFIAHEMVAYMDNHYRTIATAGSRGLAGHSMGGYGTMRIGTKYPEVFSSIYLLSPASLAPFKDEMSPQQMAAIASVKTMEDFDKIDFFTKYLFASAAAWSPNLNKPPFYVDFPFQNGKPLPYIQAKWIANSPLAMLDANINKIRSLHAIAFDAGDQDTNIAASIRILDTELNKYNVKHSFAIYNGTHIDHIGQRISQHVLGFFSNNLMFAN